MSQVPDFSKFIDLENEALNLRLKSIRTVLEHSGEKGRVLEKEIMNILLAFLPAEYGLSTGFIAYHTGAGPKLSSQIDIIIYDALRSGPIIRFDVCDVFPLEAVYAYVEVKTKIRNAADPKSSDSIQVCLKKSAELRGMLDRRYYKPVENTLTRSELSTWEQPIAIQSYVFALEYAAKETDSAALCELIQKEASKTQGSFLTGLFIGSKGYFHSTFLEHDGEADCRIHSCEQNPL